MLGSRLDGSRDPLGAVTSFIAELKKGGRSDSWLIRAAAFAQPEVPVAMLERLISMDSLFGTRLNQSLSLAYAAHGVNAAKTLQEAIAILGDDRVKSVGVLSAIDLVSLDLCRRVGIPARLIVLKSVATAGAAAHIAERYRGADVSEARIAGLFRYIGIPIIAATNGQKYKAAWDSLAGGAASISEVEKMSLGYTHEDVGNLVATQYGLPTCIGSAMNAQRRSLAELAGIPFCVEAGAIMAHQLGFDGGAANMPPALPLSELARVGIPEADLSKLADEVGEEVNLASQMLTD